jgi:hypothetical protein
MGCRSIRILCNDNSRSYHALDGIYMITPETLMVMASFDTALLTSAINRAGYKRVKFTDSKFVGLTNAGEFAYWAQYLIDEKPVSSKVFLQYDHASDKITAGY